MIQLSIEGLLVHFSYLAVFLLIAASGAFLPLPEEIVLIVGGYLASLGFLRLPLLIPVALLGTLVGDNIAFWIGRKRGIFFFKPIARFLFATKRIAKAQQEFHKHSAWMVFSARFLVGVRFLGPILAGASQMPWKRFQFYNFLGAIIWIPAMTGVGYFLGRHIERLFHDVEFLRHVLIVVFIVVALIAVLIIWRKRKQR